MTEAKLGPKMQEWQVEHSNLYLNAAGRRGTSRSGLHRGCPEMGVYSLILTTTGRKSGEKFAFSALFRNNRR